MGLIERAIPIVERLAWPDVVSQAGISFLVGRTSRRLHDATGDSNRAFVRDMARHPIAAHVEDANAQHYEVPAAFFALVLGPQRKYSCCLYDDESATLEQAEERALAETAAHAGLADGQRILELGCGWGSLSLWMARRYPAASIVAVSNSHSQRAFIEAEAKARQLPNLTVITADMNTFAPQGRFDRIVSVEMFEHIANWQALLARVGSWIAPGGRLFLHVFSHSRAPYRFDRNDKADWIAQHFFTGGIMPSHRMIDEFAGDFDVAETWRWSGVHYRRTAEDWLLNFDRNGEAIGALLRTVYGGESELWRRRWRLFFLATAGLFGHGGGKEWGVSHWLLAPRRP